MKPVVLVTDLARAKILDLLNEEEAATPQGLRIEVTGESGPEYRYELSFDALDSAEADDSVVDWLGLGVIVPASSIDKLQGATLDLPAGGSGMVLRNPNRPNPLAGLDVELTGEVARAHQPAAGEGDQSEPGPARRLRRVARLGGTEGVHPDGRGLPGLCRLGDDAAFGDRAHAEGPDPRNP